MAVEYEISEIQLPTYSCNMYYICKCRWHSYFRYWATNNILYIKLILMPQNFWIFLRCLSGHSSWFFLDILDIPGTCITFQHLAPNLLVDIPQMFWKFCIFPEHLPEHQGCLFWTFCTFPGDVLHLFWTFQTFSSPIYLCTSGWCSGHSAFFQDIYLNTSFFFLQIFWTLTGHVLHLAYLFQIFQTFSSSFICAHSHFSHPF